MLQNYIIENIGQESEWPNSLDQKHEVKWLDEYAQK